MNSTHDAVAGALRAATRAKVHQAIGPVATELSLADVGRLTRHLRSLDRPARPLKLAILHTYTTELLQPHWRLEALLNGFELDLYEAPYGALLQEAQPGGGLRDAEPDLVFLFMRWEDLDPRLQLPLAATPPAEHGRLREAILDHPRLILSGLRAAVAAPIVITLLPPMFGPALGIHDAMAADSEAAFRAQVKASLAATLRDTLPSVYFDDLDQLLERHGRQGLFDQRLWQTSRFPFTVRGARAVARRLMTYAVLTAGARAKCIVLDADNTLWGGIVGEDGPDGIALGPDYPGSVFVAFQRRLLDFQQRGLLLALCSKNNPEDVQEVLDKHPHQLLRAEHLAALRVNWSPKPANLRALAEELNLGLDSFVFVDDSPHECHAVRRELPQVTVVQRPAQLTDVPHCLDWLPTLEVLSLTDEDRRRTGMYVQQRRRRELKDSAGDFEQYLKSLGMVMTIGVDEPRHAPRIAQLTQRTNQFNLTTRRYTEAEIRALIADHDVLVADFSLADTFGDSGLVGVCIVRGMSAGEAEVDSLLMSCRVIGRAAETAFLGEVLRMLQQRGVRRARAAYRPTQKNALVRDFWPRHGFQPTGTDEYQLDLVEYTHAESGLIRVSAAQEVAT